MATDPAKLERVFDAARVLSPADREAFLDDACEGNPELRTSVESLLLAHDRTRGFLETQASATSVGPLPVLEAPGTVIGRYKILEPIGEGGYGTVFMAEQTSPVHRKVALKIIKAGMDTKQVIARFEAERQALALMDHPNIAKVFDAGVTDAGRPYFVMELVKGLPITKYCDEHKLTPRQRLELFVQVCHAVQHAHQKGIIHRDIKPSNVLIALYDGKPVPKVIDFGVAKAIGQQLTERTMFSGFGDVIGTPQYMSPEQAELNQLDVDTRSDIYSLGVLLYELLTGTTPLETKRVREAALLEVLRVIREEEPPKPSTRLTATAELPSIAAQRGLEPKHLTKMVHGELDWIVMKALEKERTRRYETANGFASDIQRYLADEQVLACPPSTGYRFRKFARRNKRPLLAASAMLAMLLLLVAGLAVSNVRVARERNQKAAALKEREEALTAAEAERQRAQNNFTKARTAVTRILAKAATGQDQWSKLSPELRKVFSDETALYYRSLIQEGSADPSLRFETAVAYRSLGFLHSSAKEFEKAEKYYRESIQMLEAMLNESGNDVEYRYQLAYSNSLLGSILKATTRPAEAQAAYERAAELYEGLFAQARSDIQYPPELWKCYNALLQIHAARRSDDDLRRTRERAERVCREWVRLVPNDATVHQKLGFILRERRKLDEAAGAYRKAIELAPQDRHAHNNLGAFLSNDLQDYDQAVACFRRAIEIDPTFTRAYHNLGITLAKQKNLPEAVAAIRKAIELDPKFAPYYRDLGIALRHQGELDEAVAALSKASELDPKSATAFYDLGIALKDQGKLDDAIAAYHKAIELNPNFAGAYNNLGSALQAQGKLDDAVAAYQKTIELDPKFAFAYDNLGCVLQARGKLDEAVAVHRKAIELDPKLANAFDNLGNALRKQKKVPEAIAAYHKAIELDPRFVRPHVNLGAALIEQEKLPEAIAAYRKAIEIDPKYAHAYGGLGNALRGQKKLDAAVAAYRKSLELAPNADIYNNLGALLCDELKEYDQAIECFRKAIEIDPKFASTQSNLGIALQAQGKLDEAVAAHRKAIEIDPKNASAHYNLGIALSKLNRPREALDAYTVALAIDPKSANACNDLAWLLATCPDVTLRDPGRAVTLAKKGVELDPKNGAYLNTLGVACYRTGDWNGAVANLEKSVRLREGGDSNDWFFLAMARWQLGEKDAARQSYDRAVKWMEKNASNNEELTRFRREAAELLGVNEPK